ncbi:MAG: hypothetical protein WCI43_00805 [Candidatus Firestonebacteria bacterium]
MSENKGKRQNLATALFSLGLLSILGIALNSLKAWMFIALVNVVVCVIAGFFLLSEETKRD